MENTAIISMHSRPLQIPMLVLEFVFERDIYNMMRIWKKGLLFLSIHTPSKFRIYFNEIFNTNVLITRICFYRDELYIINEL